MDKKYLDFIDGRKFLEELSNYQPPNNGFAPWS
jgi:hypothetical protein